MGMPCTLLRTGHSPPAMPISVQPPKLHTLDSPRSVFLRLYPGTPPLPVLGGWGYQIEDAVEIEQELLPDLDLKAIQTKFIELRVVEELVLSRPETQRFSGIRRKVQSRERVNRVGRFYDVVKVEVKAIPEAQFAALQVKLHRIGEEQYRALLEEQSIRYVATYWFNVSKCV